MVNVMGGALYFFIALGILVTIHELGHFLAARACHVKVLRFSLGFGPILFKTTGKDGCEYAVSCIPLGGYVKMEGENAPVTEEEKKLLSPTSFKAQSVLKRAIIIFAGPFFNIALAVILLTGVYLNGVVEKYAVVGYVTPNSVAAQSGFKAYDRIDAVNSQPVNTWSDFIYPIVENLGDATPLAVTVRGDIGQDSPRTLSLPLNSISLQRNESPFDKIGIRVCVGKLGNDLGYIQENSPAKRAGLQVGDRILEINGQSVESWYEIQDTIKASKFEKLNLIVERDGSKYETQIEPQAVVDKVSKKNIPFVGVGAHVEKIEGLQREVEYSLGGAVKKAVVESITMSKLVLVSSYKLINGTISTDNISGPIAIAKGAQESASFGLAIFISFLAAISVNLGILNLLPIPVLDGGQLVFLAYEAIMRREPSAKIQMTLTFVGAFILLTLTIFAIFNDIQGL